MADLVIKTLIYGNGPPNAILAVMRRAGKDRLHYDTSGRHTRVLMAARVSRKTRRVYPAEFKREVIAQCLEPGASVSVIPLTRGINANVIRKWPLREKLPATHAQRRPACNEQATH